MPIPAENIHTIDAQLVEPALALYCPIEGGDYVLDETVREMARRTGADVVVLDAVQLAAGECGHFGKGASVLRFCVLLGFSLTELWK